MISAVFIPAGPLDQPTFTYSVRDNWSLDAAIYEAIGCDTIDSVVLGKGQIMYVDDLGRSKGLPLNGIATALYHRLRGGDMIVGNALILGYDNEGETCSVSTDTLLVVAKIATFLADNKTGGFSELA